MAKQPPSKLKSKSSKPKIIRDIPENRDIFWCVRCPRTFKNQKGNFPATQSPIYKNNNSYLPICKHCLDELYEHYCRVLGDEDAAIRRICMKFDIYYNQSLADASRKISSDRSRISTYVSRANLTQYRDNTYDSTLDEEKTNVIETAEDFEQLRAEGKTDVSKTSAERWGIGMFNDGDYKALDEHYKMLKKQNPNCDSNQEIFIKDLCYIKLQQMKAMRTDKFDDFDKATKTYRDTFKSAGLKVIQESDSSSDEVLGVTLATISQYTPEEYYKDKNLYKDFDGLGDYIKRFLLRPLKNLQLGTKERDSEYQVRNDENEE